MKIQIKESEIEKENKKRKNENEFENKNKPLQEKNDRTHQPVYIEKKIQKTPAVFLHRENKENNMNSTKMCTKELEKKVLSTKRKTIAMQWSNWVKKKGKKIGKN